MLFAALCAVHVAVWVFVLLAWVHTGTALWNLRVVVPAIYVIHALMPHPILLLKKTVDPLRWKERQANFESALVLPKLIRLAKEHLFPHAFASPLSPQGMLILGCLTSSYRLHGAVKCH